MKLHNPTIDELSSARSVFEANEPRDLFYRAATELVSLALQNATSLSVAEALAVLLQTWNRPFYQYRKFNVQHFKNIEELIINHQSMLGGYRKRALVSLNHEDEKAITYIFQDFEKVLGPVGAAKALHLLAPKFFPLWDRAIADAYQLSIGRAGTNGKRYFSFMEITEEQVKNIGGMDALGRNPLKAIDEYNYCRYTKGWVTQ
jgi:hypothetical protein